MLTKCYSGDQIKKKEKGGACSMCGGQERANRGLMEKRAGKKTLGRFKRRREGNIKMDF